MADRFPSLDEFDAGQTEAKDIGDTNLVGDSTDASDFLQRERAALGDDAAQFSTPGDNLATVEDAEDDLLADGALDGVNGTGTLRGAQDEMSGFESSFPAIDTSNEAVAPGGTITGTTAPYMPPSSYQPVDEGPEPEVIREWRERRDLAVQHRDERSAQQKSETIKAAQGSIDEFYENYNTKKEKGITQTRKDAEEFLANRDDTTAGGTSWERIAKLVDLSGKGAVGGASGTGKAKFRDLLLSLRKDEKAPGATGY